MASAHAPVTDNLFDENASDRGVRVILPSGRTIYGAYDNGGRLHDVTYPEAGVSMTYFDNTDRVLQHRDMLRIHVSRSAA